MNTTSSLPFPLPLDNPLFVPAVSALLLLLIYALYKTLFGSASKKRRTILLLGNLESGKTAILSTLIHNQTPQTHTSLQPNTSLLSIPIRPPSAPKSKSSLYTLIDTPGHPRLRASYLPHLSSTHTILFVVDTSTIARSTSPGSAALVAEYLHTVLYQLSLLSEDPIISKKGGIPKLVIVAHKVDLVNTGGAALLTSSSASGPGTTKPKAATKSEIGLTRVRTILERELTRRANDLKRSVGIEGLGSDANSSASRTDLKLQTDAGMVIDASSGHTGLECIASASTSTSTSTGGGDGFKFDAWEYGEIEFVSIWVTVRSEEYEYATEDGDEKREKVEEKPVHEEEDGLRELKEWLNENLA